MPEIAARPQNKRDRSGRRIPDLIMVEYRPQSGHFINEIVCSFAEYILPAVGDDHGKAQTPILARTNMWLWPRPSAGREHRFEPCRSLAIFVAAAVDPRRHHQPRDVGILGMACLGLCDVMPAYRRRSSPSAGQLRAFWRDKWPLWPRSCKMVCYLTGQ
jgi:hypothetical protein